MIVHADESFDFEIHVKRRTMASKPWKTYAYYVTTQIKMVHRRQESYIFPDNTRCITVGVQTRD